MNSKTNGNQITECSNHKPDQRKGNESANGSQIGKSNMHTLSISWKCFAQPSHLLYGIPKIVRGFNSLDVLRVAIGNHSDQSFPLKGLVFHGYHSQIKEYLKLNIRDSVVRFQIAEYTITWHRIIKYIPPTNLLLMYRLSCQERRR